MFDINTHEYADYALMKEKRERLMREARMQQLWNKADEERSQLGERLMGLVGDLMIAGGQKLKARSGNPAPIQYTVEAQRS
jgi:hypothetical protein